jgi:UDPglucose 6-dehydrogenase/GDP-mannose 6-dehydrogenase
VRAAVVGAGYVGLTAAACLAGRGHDVTCVDIDDERVAAILAGFPPFHEPGLSELLGAGVANGYLAVTTKLDKAIREAEVVFVAVGTPESADGVDLSYVSEAAAGIGTALRGSDAYRVVTVKSTVPPGTTDTHVRETLEEHSGLSLADGDFGLCMNPEFLREGTAVDDFENPGRIVLGCADERSATALRQVYASYDCPVLVTSIRNAEMAKYAANALLATLVSFSNEMAALCEATPGTDVAEVLRAVHFDRRLMPFVDGERIEPGILSFLWAGSGYGGSCLPKDLAAIRAFARANGVEPIVLDAVAAVNDARPVVLELLVEQALGSLEATDVAVLGLAFKPGTDDVRASPALRVVDGLRARGARVRVYDPLVSSFDGMDLRGSPEEALDAVDAAVLVTAPPGVADWDWTTLCASMRRPVIVDGRAVLTGVRWPEAARYLTIGRTSS